ncbi:hypothetical protein L6452_30142 [Arctium lappa]|uniref:Uncharacterized protein n=1 Tax=Arctium lappa TaxID=4217 RepID=A0ACB8ZI82_ARCLA|nr:hypothetical protein L6452_30142 [Arctium lappa]
MDQGLIQAAWNGDVDHLLREIDNNPSTLLAVVLEGSSETPLHIACFVGHLNFAETVIKFRQEFCRELNQDGFSPLHIAAACGHAEIVKELLKIDLGLCLIKGKDRKIPLHLAVVKGKVEVVSELLLSSLDSVDCTTAQGETALHLAVKNNQFEAFQVLIHHLKQVNKEDLLNSKDFHGNTILHLAVSRKQYEVVDFLINGQVISKEKMELNSLNRIGLTPLDMLLMFQSEAGDREIEEILVRSGSLKAENLQYVASTQEEIRPNHPCENHRSPAGNLFEYFKYNNLKDSPSLVRNTLLVIVILIATATYQPALNPPGGVWQEDLIPSAGNNYTLLSDTNNITATKPHIAGQSILATQNEIAYSIFLFFNSVGFFVSLYMISVLTIAFPLRSELQVSTFAVSVTYCTCMQAIAPHNFIGIGFIVVSIALPITIRIMSMLLRYYWKRHRNVSARTNEERV